MDIYMLQNIDRFLADIVYYMALHIIGIFAVPMAI